MPTEKSLSFGCISESGKINAREIRTSKVLVLTCFTGGPRCVAGCRLARPAPPGCTDCRRTLKMRLFRPALRDVQAVADTHPARNGLNLHPTTAGVDGEERAFTHLPGWAETSHWGGSPVAGTVTDAERPQTQLPFCYAEREAQQRNFHFGRPQQPRRALCRRTLKMEAKTLPFETFGLSPRLRNYDFLNPPYEPRCLSPEPAPRVVI